MPFLFQHEPEIAFFVLGLCVLAFCIAIQARKGLKPIGWMLIGFATASAGIGLAGPFYLPHSSHAQIYVGLGSILAVLAMTSGKLARQQP